MDLQKAYTDAGPPQPTGIATNGNECLTGTQFPVPGSTGSGISMGPRAGRVMTCLSSSFSS